MQSRNKKKHNKSQCVPFAGIPKPPYRSDIAPAANLPILLIFYPYSSFLRDFQRYLRIFPMGSIMKNHIHRGERNVQ